MVSYSSIFPVSGGGNGASFVTINTDTVLSSPGFYLSDSLSTSIKVECSALATDSEVAWMNSSPSNNVVLYGLTSIDGVSIPDGKGVGINSGNGLWIKKTGTETVAKRIGSHTFLWVPGLVNVFSVPYVATPAFYAGSSTIPRTTNDHDIFYKLGEQSIEGGTPTAWANPTTRGTLTVTASHFEFDAPNIFNNNVYYSRWPSGGNTNNWIRWEFVNASVEVLRYAICTRNWSNSLPSWELQGSNNGTDWTLVHAGSNAIGISDSPTWYTSPDITPGSVYKYYRIYRAATGTSIEELCMWGDYIPD